MLLNFLRLTGNSAYKIYDLLEVKLLTRLRLSFTHLSEHKFSYNFAESLNPLYFCSLETKTTLNSFLPCQNYTTIRSALMTKIKNINHAIMYSSENDLLLVVMYGIYTVNAAIKFIENSELFGQSFFNQY